MALVPRTSATPRSTSGCPSPTTAPGHHRHHGLSPRRSSATSSTSSCPRGRPAGRLTLRHHRGREDGDRPLRAGVRRGARKQQRAATTTRAHQPGPVRGRVDPPLAPHRADGITRCSSREDYQRARGGTRETQCAYVQHNAGRTAADAAGDRRPPVRGSASRPSRAEIRLQQPPRPARGAVRDTRCCATSPPSAAAIAPPAAW